MPVFRHREMTDFARSHFRKGGMATDKAEVVARTLVEADLLGHTTHGLRLLPGYLDELSQGKMKPDGEPTVKKDGGSTLVWDGGYLPGPWLVERVLDWAYERVKKSGIVWASVGRSHHIACLEAYLLRPVSDGYICLIATSDPAVGTVAPFGGISPVYTPNPIAFGVPTDGTPILVDISTSTTANGVVNLFRSRGEGLPGQWLLDNQGYPTDDPNALFSDPPGTVLPLGGYDLGYKGFALGVMVEALTQGLAGHGRADGPDQWGCSFSVLLMDPESFGGREELQRQLGWLVDACHASPTRPGADRVLLPGERGLARRRKQMEEGLSLDDQLVAALGECAQRFGVELPRVFS